MATGPGWPSATMKRCSVVTSAPGSAVSEIARNVTSMRCGRRSTLTYPRLRLSKKTVVRVVGQPRREPPVRRAGGGDRAADEFGGDDGAPGVFERAERCFRCEALAPAALHEMEPDFEIRLAGR